MINENLNELALNALETLKELEDLEMVHVEADKILCSLLKYEGYDEVVEKFEKLQKWYA